MSRGVEHRVRRLYNCHVRELAYAFDARHPNVKLTELRKVTRRRHRRLARRRFNF